MSKVKEEWAREIMGQALAEIQTETDVKTIIEKVKGTALGVRKDLMKIFRELIEAKRTAGLIKK